MTDEYTMVRFWIRDGERETYEDAIVTKEQGNWSDKKLILHCIDDASPMIEECSGAYWVYDTEALAAVYTKKPMSSQTRELFNSYGIGGDIRMDTTETVDILSSNKLEGEER